MVGIRSGFERVRGVKEPWAKSARMVIFPTQKVIWVTSESGDGRAEKPREDVPQGVDVKNRYLAELANQRRLSG